ncbi:sulfate/molybdate ABC transporter ATP-binding protein [Insolitispirillum peregrinum]|uniref:Sulfate transport system ATP-binding protein n=1 Tax=Insolitispirillum peregrinum TaxID=80876 RepID=A0A1N7IHG9_9PROT|nr:sulfate ABC transporter ATP-binding protein [Insolitispirillum peregrinum]SIS36518.1 sulfate transport system ATP-binding protein [Insolitispirillum peregrinum]
MKIDIRNLHKDYNGSGVPALNGVNLTIEHGELVALLGPSGSGKTTLLRSIAGLESPTSGAILFDGQDALHQDVRDRNVGFVFQHYALFRHMTVLDNVGFGLSVRPRNRRPAASEIDRRARELLALVQLDGLEGRYPSQLSGGQRQRVALARALAIEPSVLLLDEPFGALDAKVRKDLRAWLRDLHDRTGHTTVFVTHDQEEALELADRVAIVNRGQIEQIAPPLALYRSPATPFVYEFLGSVNVLPVDVRDGKAFLDGCPVPLADAAQGTDAGAYRMYVRPHDLRLSEQRTPGSGALGVLQNVRLSGGLVRLDLKLDLIARPIEVELPVSDPRWSDWKKGDKLAIAADRFHLFPQAA